MSFQTAMLDYMSTASQGKNKDEKVVKRHRERQAQFKESASMPPNDIESSLFIESPLINVYGQRVGTIQERRALSAIMRPDRPCDDNSDAP